MCIRDRPDIDLVVLGGGLAGLSLAERLSAAGDRAPRTLVLEARARYEDDRTWCFWRLEPHRYDALAAASWSRFVVRDRGREATCDCADTPYQMIPSGAFYEHARDAIAGRRTTLGSSLGLTGLARTATGAATGVATGATTGLAGAAARGFPGGASTRKPLF